jgi:hypothetical protein
MDSTGYAYSCYKQGTEVPDTASVSAADFTLIVSFMRAEVTELPSWTTAGLSADEGCVSFTGDNNLTSPEKCKLVVSPNPAEDYINVEMCPKLSLHAQNLKIYDHVGRIIYSGQTNILRPTLVNCSRYPQGVYYVRVATENEPMSAKVMIIR